MMDDADDNHHMLFHTIEKVVFAVRQAADAFAQVGAGHSDIRMRREQVKGFIKAQEIGVRCLCIELFNAIFANGDEIGARGWA